MNKGERIQMAHDILNSVIELESEFVKNPYGEKSHELWKKILDGVYGLAVTGPADSMVK